MTRAEWKRKYRLARLLVSRWDSEDGDFRFVSDKKSYHHLPACVKTSPQVYWPRRNTLSYDAAGWRLWLGNAYWLKKTEAERKEQFQHSVRDAIRSSLRSHDMRYMPVETYL